MPVQHVKNNRLYIKMAQICRYRIAGLKDTKTAELMGLSNSGLQRILRLSEYQEMETAALQGQISKMDEILAGKTKEMQKTFAVGVPLAMRTLLETVTQRRDLRAAMDAAKELLDRDPERSFAKVSKQLSAMDSGQPGLPQEVLDNAVSEADKIQASLHVVVGKPGNA